MNLDLGKYQKMRDLGASPLAVAKQLRSDGVDGIEFFKILRGVFVSLSLEDSKKLNILSSGITIDEWAKSNIQTLEGISQDDANESES